MVTFFSTVEWRTILLISICVPIGYWLRFVVERILIRTASIITHYDWQPKNAIRFHMWGCRLSPSGALEITLVVENLGPIPWGVRRGVLDHVRIGPTIVSNGLVLRGITPGSVIVPAHGSCKLTFAADSFDAKGLDLWAPVFIGEDERTSFNKRIAGGFVEFAHDEYNAAVPVVYPVQGVVSTADWQVNHSSGK